jgi:hypothetical protein
MNLYDNSIDFWYSNLARQDRLIWLDMLKKYCR